jgi:hypothetical protein
MRYESVFTVTFEAGSDAEARETAGRHHEQLRDDLLIEGADHPFAIELKHIYAAGRDVLAGPASKSIYT